MAIQTNQQQIIDSRFFVPKGVVDMRQDDGTNHGYVYTPDTLANADGTAPILSKPGATTPMPATSYQIVDQHVRVAADGSTVVDVTLEFPDIPGVQSIDVRTTKAS